MGQNKLIIAAAGSGKTDLLVREALNIKNENVLITTFTENNEKEIRERLIKINRCVPKNITVQTWISFLLQHGVRPYQDVLFNELFDKHVGFCMLPGQSAKKIPESNIYHYFTNDMKIYPDKISKFTYKCNEKVEDRIFNRIQNIYKHIFIDEVQDLAGWDLEILKKLGSTTANILLVGDPRQTAYSTNQGSKNSAYKDGKISKFLQEQCGGTWEVDKESLNKTHRNHEKICTFSAKIFPDFPEPIQCDCCNEQRVCEEGHVGVFLVKEGDVNRYCEKYNPQILKERMSSYPEINYGDSKGLEYDRVLLYPTDHIKKWIKNNGNSDLKSKTRCKFYIAVTRARKSVGIVFDYTANDNFEGVKKWNDRQMSLF